MQALGEKNSAAELPSLLETNVHLILLEIDSKREFDSAFS